MNDDLREAARQIIFASIDYRIWRIYSEPADREKYLPVIQKYSSFFSASRWAHFRATIITLYGLYERRPDSISLSCLVKDTPDGKLRRELEPMLDQALEIWPKIAILRNKVAHLCDTDTDAAFRRAELSPNELERLIELSKALLNKLSCAHHCGPFPVNAGDPRIDTNNLLNALLRDPSQQQTRRQRS